MKNKLSNNNICLVNNYASHYRESIFLLLDKELSIDFYFGTVDNGIKKLNYKHLSNFIREFKNFVLIKPFYFQLGSFSVFTNKKYDKFIITGEYFCLSTWFLLIYGKIFNKKVYLWTHGWYGNEKYLKKHFKKIFFSLSEGIFLYGNYAKNLLIKEGFKESKLHVLYNSLNYELQLKIRKNLINTEVYKNYFKNDNQTIIFIGRLNKEKKLKSSVNLIKNLEDNGISVNLVFIGDGDDKKNIENYLNFLEIKEYWFYGECYDELIIGELIYNATLCLSPGNVGLTAIHSLMYGTPVFTHSDFKYQGPEFESIEEGITGSFFNKVDEFDMLCKVKNWLIEKTDREKIRYECYKVVDEKYNPNYQLDVIKKAINNG